MSNYTPAMIAKLQAAAPLDLAKAKALASDFGNVSHRSVISKAKHLGLDYVVTAKAKAVKGITKAELTNAIRQAVALPNRKGDLSKAELDVILSNLA